MRYQLVRRPQAEISARRNRQRFAPRRRSRCSGRRSSSRKERSRWAAFRGAQRETDMALLADTVRVDLEGQELRITLCTVTSVGCLARRKTTLIERARQIVPAFPQVQFGCGRIEEAKHAA
jgi:hypothetical protein